MSRSSLPQLFQTHFQTLPCCETAHNQSFHPDEPQPSAALSSSDGSWIKLSRKDLMKWAGLLVKSGKGRLRSASVCALCDRSMCWDNIQPCPEEQASRTHGSDTQMFPHKKQNILFFSVLQNNPQDNAKTLK